MAKASVRQDILLRSVQRLLPESERVRSVVMMSTRHRWFLPYTVVSAMALYGVAAATGVTDSLNRVVLAFCGAAIAGIATTNHSVLAETDDGLLLCRSSRIRQYAKELVQRLPDDAQLEMVGSTVITSDWRVDGVIYTLTKRWESTMRQVAGQFPNDT